MPDDFADRHVDRWHEHWADIPFEDQVEASVVRVARLARHFRHNKQVALARLGLQEFEYDTLHMLMVREVPGRATPRDLAVDLGVSPAGMTGRLDVLEKAGYIKRIPSSEDRRRVDVEATRAGIAVWRKAVALRGTAEEEVMAALSARELATLNRLLRKLALRSETG